MDSDCEHDSLCCLCHSLKAAALTNLRGLPRVWPMSKRPKEPPIYFTSLELENVRCFGERQTLDLTDDEGKLAQWTLLLGDNGVGKTTLLQCLAWMRPVPAMESREDSTPDTIAPALDSEENEVWDSLLRVGTEVQLDLKATLSVGRALGTQQKRGIRKIETNVRMLGENGVIQERVQTEGLSNRPNSIPRDLPIFAYGADRRMGSSNLENADLFDPLASLFSGSTELYDAEEILLNLDYLAEKSKDRRDKERLQRIKQILADILPGIQDEGDIAILGPKVLGRPDKPSGVRFKTLYGWVPLSGLSLGYQTALAWMVDLASRLYKHYPDSQNPLAEPAIVFVDEIDLHLHPRWQRQIMGDLTHHFPKAQFIATSHSPSIAQAATNANLAVLHQEDGRVVIENRPLFVEAWRVDQVQTSNLFGVPSARSPQYESLIAEHHGLLDKTRRSKAEEKRLKELDKELDALPTAENHEDQAAMDLIRRMAANLRE